MIKSEVLIVICGVIFWNSGVIVFRNIRDGMIIILLLSLIRFLIVFVINFSMIKIINDIN